MKKSGKEEISNYYKGRAIAKEAIDLLETQSAANDHPKLDKFIEQNEFSKELFNRLTDSDQLSDVTTTYNREEKFKGVDQLKTTLEAKNRTHHRRMMLYIVSSVASAVLFASFLILSYGETERNSLQYSIKAENRNLTPTLTMGNGECITLNTEDSIISNKNATIRIKGTKISYQQKKQEGTQVSYNKIEIPAKYTYTIILEDSTEVHLNANSELRYPTHFASDKREVFLKGEAYFNVQKGKKPFIVNVEELSIKVYGTKFNINTNSRDAIETVLVTGSIGVTVNGDHTKEVMISPNQLFLFNTKTKEENLQNVNTTNYLAWTNNRFISDNGDSLMKLLDQIALWYDLEFEYKNPKIATTPVTVSLKRSSNIDSILKVIEKISDVQFIKKGLNKYEVE